MRRFVLYAMGALVAFGFVVWSTTGVARACDPATGVGCDTPPATAASPPASAPQAPAAPQQPATGGGEPFIPPGAQSTPTPSSTLATPPSSEATPAPVVPATDEASSSSGGSGGGGVPWKWALAIPVVAAAGVGVAVATRKKPPMDPLVEYNRACGEMCWMKQVEAQSDAEAAAAQTALTQVDDAWQKARAYLRDWLREDYIFQKKWRAFGTLGNIILGGPFMWAGAVGFYSTTSPATHRFLLGTPRDWSDEVNQELLTAQGEIDRIHFENSERFRRQLADATKRSDDAINGRHAAETKLVTLKAQNSEITFPECECG
jgi:hypothetical protein